MHALKLLGEPAILDSAGRPLEGRAGHRHPIAVLALLARAPGRSMGRERLIGVLWPERTGPRARHRLTVAVHTLRKSLGPDVIRSVADELRLDPDFPVDLSQLHEAVRDGAWERAAALWSGPALDGFFLDDAPEFERWADAERAAAATAAARALDAVGRAAAERGDWVEALDAGRRLQSLQPTAVHGVLWTMRALAALGDRAAALREATRHAQLLEEEFGAAPDPEVEALAAGIASGPAGPRNSERASHQPGHAVGDRSAGDAMSDRRTPAPVPDSVTGPGVPPHAEPDPPLRHTRASGDLVDGGVGDPARAMGRSDRPARNGRPSPRAWAAAVVLGLLLLALGLAWSRRDDTAQTEGVPEESVTRVAVLPFSVAGGRTFEYLGEGMVDLFSAGLDGVPDLHVVDPRALLGRIAEEPLGALDPTRAAAIAAGLGADLYVLGSVIEAAGRLQLHATLYRDTVIVARARTGHAAEERVFDLVDELARRLLVERHLRAEPRFSGSAAATTASLPALRAYLAGESDFRRGSYATAWERFREAVAHDDSFALAHYRAALAAEWHGGIPEIRAASERALALADRLPSRERRVLEAYAAYVRGDADRAEYGFRSLTHRDPDDVEAWFGLGETLFHYGPRTGRPLADARFAFERVVALQSGHREALLHLFRIAVAERDGAAADSLIARLGWKDAATSGVGLSARALYQFARGDAASRAAALDALRRADGVTALVAAAHVAMFAQDIEGAASIARMLDTPEREPDVRSAAHLLAAELSVARGRIADAMRELDRAAEFAPHLALAGRATIRAMPFVPLGDAGRESILAELARNAPTPGPAVVPPGTIPHLTAHPALDLWLAHYLPARIRARGEGEAGLETAAERIDSFRAPEGLDALVADIAAGLRAQAAWRAGDPGYALERIESMTLAGWYQFAVGSPWFARSAERWLRAELLREAGRDRDAITAYNAFHAFSPHDLPYLAPSHLRRAEIHDRLGEHRTAATHYARFVELWVDADVELRADVVRARRRATELRGLR